MSDDDPLIRMRAELDQAIASFSEQARVLRAHFLALTEAGFTPEQAIRLTGQMLRFLLEGAGGDDA